MKRFEISLVIGIVVSIAVCSISAFAQECGEIRKDVLRLHILANSDLEEDQELKLAVRDAVLEGTQELFASVSGKEEIKAKAEENNELIREIAQRTVAEHGRDYDIKVSIVNMYFETREYGDNTLPAGRYDAVRIVIGEGAGHNWWCVMFPPMCIPAATDKESTSLEEQIHDLGQTPRYEPKFAVVEAVENLRDSWNTDDDK